MQRLPGRIAAVMTGTIVIFVATLGGFTLWMSHALDDQAWEQSEAQIREAQDNLLEQMRLTAIDYAKWGTAVEEIGAGNLDWTLENVGSSALAGQVLHLAVVWGGRYGKDFGWTDDGVEEPRSGLVDPALLGQVESRLATVPLRAYDAARFFVWREGSLYAVGAARLEDLEAPDASSPGDDETERLLLGRRLSDEDLAEIGDRFRLAGLGVVGEEPADRPSVPLAGVDGEHIAHLAWDAPEPGTRLLVRMLPLMAIVILLAVGLTLFGMVLVRRNAQRLVWAEQRASAAARTDAMTGLPNRATYNIALSEPAAAGERAVVFLDVNGFKRVNDSLGHDAGDELIVGLARRLERLAGADCLLARIGGDEFVFVLTGPNAGPRAEWLAQAAQALLVTPFDIQGHRMQVRAAIGYAVQNGDDMEGEDLVRQADLAMYEAKRLGGRSPVGFGDMIEAGSSDARAVERALRDALQRPGELWLAYQPIVSADGAALARAEALVRWTSPELGPVRPDVFVPVAERAGLVIELGRRLLDLVCDDLSAHPGLKVSVNVSPIHLLAPDFLPDLTGMLRGRGIDPGRIEVEITESVLIADPGLAARRIRALHEAGIGTALDDFGTGYTSIGALRQMEFETMKIDRSYVTGLAGAPDRVALLSAMILLGHAMGLGVVCEGVETREELAILRELGCDLVQGYAIDRPLPIGALAARWLGAPRSAVA